MSYHDLIFQNIDKVYQAGIATKIMQHMARIRNSSDVNQARRWVMELLQNARDVAYPDQPVKIRITLEEDKLTFSHTGMPFRVENILAIINQVSSKVDDEETVGQFGTGFVTTFQLSEQVQLDGVLKDEGLPYKPFSVLIDRCRTDFADIQNKKECGGNRQWQNHYLRNWAANTKGKGII